MKKVLAVYYTQSGQLKRILDSILAPLDSKEIEIDYLELKPENDYPFPWGDAFFKIFPECVKGIPTKLKPFDADLNKDYDLVILGHQPWFLSPSIPLWSFLLSNEGSTFLKGKNVITVHGARNMWAGPQESIKEKLAALNANLVGNIVLQDRTDNVVAAYTIIKWLVYGNKGPSGIIPEAGVSRKDIEDASAFGKLIKEALLQGSYDHLQSNLIKQGAVRVKFHLLNIEINAKKIFRKFADLAVRKEAKGEKYRLRVVKQFKIYLLFALFIISPFVSLIFMILRILTFPWANRTLEYYRGVKLKSKQ